MAAGEDRFAMADRAELIDRLCTALAEPAVDGVLAAPDLLEDLLLAGALEGRLAVGSVNRAGLPGAVFEVDDRSTGTSVASAVNQGLDAAKLLVRIDREDRATAAMLERAAAMVSGLAAARIPTIVEPFVAVVESAVVAAALGDTSAYTWLKLPVVREFDRVAGATGLPVVLLGGEVADDADDQHRGWSEALAEPTVHGIAVGRSLLFPADGDVTGSVRRAATLLGR